MSSKKKHTPPPSPPPTLPPRLPRTWRFVVLTGLVISMLAVGSYLFGDWWYGLPDDAVASYVGRAACVDCHPGQTKLWLGSDHDLAMDLATSETVLGDFNDATLEHHGMTSRMFRDGDRFMVHTEGPDGKMTDFPVKYVFGIRPLQQYMVEMKRPADMPENEISQVQVLRLSWDTEKKSWFYLNPPDVKEKLAPNDPLHWTQAAQNWNHMCAVCHSTDLQKNFNEETLTYHTTFSEIDVSCEACHGPASLHVQMANTRSLFWDRKLGYGLKRLKDTDNRPQIESCAPCHSRRRVFAASNELTDGYYDHCINELLGPDTYYADGQILDEVYVYGSFIQSKMFHNEIRCTDCHDPHTTRVYANDNTLCTSCHTHQAEKYDSVSHHHHLPDSEGAKCVNCHMPATPYMDVDYRRDHGMRIPRPDLSVDIGIPNACTGCHLKGLEMAPEKRAALDHYSKWLTAAREGDEEVQQEIEQVDQWSRQWFKTWYGEKSRPHFAPALHAAWTNQPDAESGLLEVASNRELPAMIRASALTELQTRTSQAGLEIAKRGLRDVDPQVRLVSVSYLEQLPRDELLKLVSPMLMDPVRAVRFEAARVLAPINTNALRAEYRDVIRQTLEEYKQGLRRDNDQAGSHMSLALLYERMGNFPQAVQAYVNAIRVQPGVTGPRSNLATLLEQAGQVDDVPRLRAEELKLLARDAQLAPEIPAVQYRYGLALYLNGQLEPALEALQEAVRLAPENADFLLALVLLEQKMERLTEALTHLDQLIQLRPEELQYRQLQQELRAQQEARRNP